MNEDCYFPHGSIIGSGVTGKEHISITGDAKKLFKKIIMEAEKTGDDLTCLDIYKLKMEEFTFPGWEKEKKK